MADAPTRLVIFDCDGTLVDSQHVIVAAMNTAFSDQALPAPPAQVTYVTGYPVLRAVQYYTFEKVRVYGAGQWLDETAVTLALKKAVAADGVFRPGMKVCVMPKRRESP